MIMIGISTKSYQKLVKAAEEWAGGTVSGEAKGLKGERRNRSISSTEYLVRYACDLSWQGNVVFK